MANPEKTLEHRERKTDNISYGQNRVPEHQQRHNSTQRRPRNAIQHQRQTAWFGLAWSGLNVPG